MKKNQSLEQQLKKCNEKIRKQQEMHSLELDKNIKSYKEKL